MAHSLWGAGSRGMPPPPPLEKIVLLELKIIRTHVGHVAATSPTEGEGGIFLEMATGDVLLDGVAFSRLY